MMLSGGAWRIATIAGVPVKLHWTFGLMVLWVAYIASTNAFTAVETFYFALFILSLFLCVVLHELGHALTARIFRIRTVDIILSPIGGLARLTHLPQKPWQELLITLAGPAVNAVIAFVLLIAILLQPEVSFYLEGEGDAIYTLPANFMPLLCLVNMMLALFNMLPAFPMDGGRVLRALLSMKWSRVQATRIASVTGQVLAVLLILLGLWLGQWILPFIGVFIFLAASAEYRGIRIEAALDQRKVADVYRDQYTVLFEFDPMHYALDRTTRSLERDFLVANSSGHIIAVLSYEHILKARKQNDLDNFIAAYKSDRLESVDAAFPLKYLLAVMQQKSYVILPVYKDGVMVGVVDRETFRQVLQ